MTAKTEDLSERPFLVTDKISLRPMNLRCHITGGASQNKQETNERQMKALSTVTPLLLATLLLAIVPSDARLSAARKLAVVMEGTFMPSQSPKVEALQQAVKQPDPVTKPLKIDTVGPMPTKSLPPIPSVAAVQSLAPKATPPAMPTKSLQKVIVEPVECLAPAKLCWDGSIAEPDPLNGCKTPSCPEPCCNPYMQFRCANGPAACCDDGNWVCPQDETGLYVCKDETSKKPPQGDICKKKICPPIALFLCEDGSEPLPDPDNECMLLPCSEPSEDSCCDPSIPPRMLCPEGLPGCCKDGTWLCSKEGVFKCDEGDSELPPAGKICGKIVKECLGPSRECEDGSIVGPDPTNGCRKPECPEDIACCDPKMKPECTLKDAVCCEDGTWTCLDPKDEMYHCGKEKLKGPPEGEVCEVSPPRGCRGMDLTCPDGTVVFQDPYNNCEYPPCPDEITYCPAIMQMCPDMETVIAPDPNNNCEMAECPTRCLSSTKTCPDGSIVGRDNKNDCEFFPCPDYDKACPEDEVKTCEDGSEVSLDPASDCKKFFPCPEFSCCNPNEEFGMYSNPFCFEGHQCCPDGTWTCSIGDGVTFSCGGVNTIGPFPDACLCSCYRSKAPNDCEKPACCEDGGWTCPDSDGNFKCGDELLLEPPNGLICEDEVVIQVEGCPAGFKFCTGGIKLERDPANDCEFPKCPRESKPCCDKSDFPLCFIGTADCCDGEWKCPDSKDGELYMCNGKMTEEPSGIICGEEEGCLEDVVSVCYDGSEVTLDPTTNCEEFFPCPELEECEEEVTQMCPDGSEVALDPSTDCEEFYPCPEWSCCDPSTKPAICREGCECCPDGTWSQSIGDGKTYMCGGVRYTGPFPEPCSSCCEPSEEPKCLIGTAGCCPDGGWTCPSDGIYDCNGDETKELPSGTVCKPSLGCTKDAKICPDGTPVGRDPSNDCEFFSCDDVGPIACTEDVKLCPDGVTTVGRDPKKNCEFFPCAIIIEPTGPKGCTKDAKMCPDGTTVGRNPDNNCEFFDCTIIDTADPQSQLCKQDEKICPGGTVVARDPEKKCRFCPCPKLSDEDRERIKAEKEVERAKRLAEREERLAEKLRLKAEREAAREKRLAERLKRQEEKEKAKEARIQAQKQREEERRKRQEEKDKAKAAKEAERAKRLAAAEKRKKEREAQKAAREAERTKRQEEAERKKKEKEAQNSVRGKKVESDSEHVQEPRIENGS